MLSVITYITVVITIHCQMSLSNLIPVLPPSPVPNASISETDVNVNENSFVFKVNEPVHDQQPESNTANSIVKVRKNSFAYKVHEQSPMQKAINKEYSKRKNTTTVNGVNLWNSNVQGHNERTIQNKNYDDSTSERLTYNQADHGQPATSDKTKMSVQDEKNLPESVPGFKSEDVVSDIDLLQALLKIMPKKNRKNVIKKIVNTFIFTSHSNNTNVKPEISTTIATPTTVKTKEPLNNADPNLETTNIDVHKSSDFHMKRENRRDRDFKEIEEVKLATTDNPQTPTEVIETDPPFLKEERFEHKHINIMNKKNKRKIRRRYNNFHRRNGRLKSSKSNIAKQNKNVESKKFGFTGEFQRMYKRLFGKRHIDASTSTTVTTLPPDYSFTTLPPDYSFTTPPPDYFSTTPPPDYYYEDTNALVDYDHINSKNPRHGQKNRQKYRDLAKSKYNWNRQSSKESFNQHQDVNKNYVPTKYAKRYNKKPFRRKQKPGSGWNIRPRNIHRKLHISSKNEASKYWGKKSNDENLKSTYVQNGNYVPYDFEVGEMRGKPHDIDLQNNNIERKLTKVRSMKESVKNSKTSKKNDISFQSAEYIISEPRVQRVPQTKIHKKNIAMPTQYDFEAPSHTLHESSKFRGLNNFELKNKSHSHDVKSLVRVDPTLLTKTVQEAVNKALANLNLVGQSNANVLSEPIFPSKVTDDSKTHSKAKKTTLGLRKSVDIDIINTFPIIDNIATQNNANNNKDFQWIDPVSVVKPDEKSKTNKEVTDTETRISLPFVMNVPLEYSKNVPTTPSNVFPSWITRKTFTRRTSSVKRRKGQRLIPQLKPSAMSDKMKTNKRSMYYTWRNGRLVSVKTVKEHRYSGQNKKNKSKESKNLSAQKGATTISPNIDSPYFDYALPTTDPHVW